MSSLEDLPEHYSELVETNYKKYLILHGYLKMCYP